MHEVQFQEDEVAPARKATIPGTSGFTKILIKQGWAKDTQSAQMLMLFIAFFCILLTIGISLLTSGEFRSIPPIPPELLKADGL